MKRMMKDHTEVLMDRFGYKVAGALSSANSSLPVDISERLRVARMHAVASRKKSVDVKAAPVVVSNGGSITLGFGAGLWENMASLIPVLVLLLGMFTLDNLQSNLRITELVEVDSALLTDDLPPSAYSDPGFAQFLKHPD
jgi:Protein of unknown function (DUF3619)